jgi:hypothetical protein
MADKQLLETILRSHVAQFPGGNDAAKQADLEQTIVKVNAALDLPMDDRRAAAQLAIEAPKLFITMALAAIVAIAALVQLGWNSFIRDNSAVLLLCFAAGFACFLSMYFGILAINEVAKRGRVIDNRWSLESGIRWRKNSQSSIGVVAIILFVIAVWLSVGNPISRGAILVQLPGTVQASLPNGITVTGNWSQLQLDGGNGVHLDLDAVPTGQTRAFEIRAR